MPRLCLWNKIRTRQWLILGALDFQCIRAGFLCSKCDNFACFYTRQDQNELHLKRWFFFFVKIDIFCKLIAGALSEAKTHWMVGWLQLPNQLNFVWRHAKFVYMMSPRTSMNGDDLMLMALYTNFLQQQQYSRVYALFLTFHALVYLWVCQFISLFSQDNEHTEQTILLFFQNPYEIFAHILQHYPRCSSVYTTIFVRRKDNTNYLLK